MTALARVLVSLLAVACATGAGHADPAKAKAANTRGYALHKAKNYKAAAVEYKKAIAEDPAYLLAHYNLACVASLLHDADTATGELAWVFDRATWDPAAKSAIAKASNDRDLAWLFDNDEDSRRYGNATNIEVLDVATPSCCFIRGKPSTDPAVARALAGAAGKHDEACSAAAVSAPADATATGKGVVAASLRDGVAILDGTGQVIARSGPIGCTGPRDQIELLNHGDAIPQPYDKLVTPLREIYYVVVAYRSGDKQTVAIYALRNKQLSRVFDAVTRSAEGAGHVELTPLGGVVHVAPGETRPRVYRWNAARGVLAPSDELGVPAR